MRNTLLITAAAAALMAGTVLANAQGGPEPGAKQNQMKQEPGAKQNQMKQEPGARQGQQGKPSTTGQVPREEGKSSKQGQKEQAKPSTSGQTQREEGKPSKQGQKQENQKS